MKRFTEGRIIVFLWEERASLLGKAGLSQSPGQFICSMRRPSV